MPTLNWIGKDKVVNHHQKVPYKVLEHKFGVCEGIETTEETNSGNLIIHGDNLEALKSLLPKYQGKVNCIYIDPPYNTGNEKWVYNDNVNHPKIQKWLGEVVGQEGEDLSRHDKWLCMMYPRLVLLHKLLADSGVIFISIDDNEYANLKLVCDEIFGVKNHLKTFIWHTEGHTDNQDIITHVHEYVICYAKCKECVNIRSVVDPNTPVDSKILRNFAENSITKNGDKNPPSIVTLPKGFPCEVENLQLAKSEGIDELYSETKDSYISRETTKKYRISYPARFDEMIVENGVLTKECRVYCGWMNLNKLQNFIQNDCNDIEEEKGTILRFYLSKNGVVYYHRSGRKPHYIQSVLQNMGTTETNRYMLEGMNVKFDFPKPFELISFLISIIANENDIILDSFAGSGTTAHAVLNLNKKDGGNRKFILIEMEDYAETATAIRIKSVMEGCKDSVKNIEGTGGAFDYYELGDRLFLEDGNLNEDIDEAKIREYIFFSETNSPTIAERTEDNKYFLGEVFNTSYYFYYEKDLKTTLTHETLRQIVKKKAEQYVIYADTCTLTEDEMNNLNVIFKKIPRDIKRF